jgi:hypothetical protein
VRHKAETLHRIFVAGLISTTVLALRPKALTGLRVRKALE